MPQPNLGTMRQRLLVRLGMGAAGSNNASTVALMNDFLRDAQLQLFEVMGDPNGVDYDEFTLNLGANTIPYTPIMGEDPIFVDQQAGQWSSPLWVDRETGTGNSPNWAPVMPGISPAMYNTMELSTWPQRFERLEDRIEVWPKADRTYDVRVWFKKALAQFTADADLLTLNENSVFLVALANAKAHYRHPDAQNYVTQATTVINKIKGRRWTQRKFNPRDDYADFPAAKPRTV